VIIEMLNTALISFQSFYIKTRSQNLVVLFILIFYQTLATLASPSTQFTQPCSFTFSDQS
jgi:hypothetical protein